MIRQQSTHCFYNKQTLFPESEDEPVYLWFDMKVHHLAHIPFSSYCEV